jgi:hypothetical protein
MPTVLVRPLLGFCRAADRLTWVVFMSDVGPSRTPGNVRLMSAYGGRADIDQPLLIDLDTNEDRRRVAAAC